MLADTSNILADTIVCFCFESSVYCFMEMVYCYPTDELLPYNFINYINISLDEQWSILMGHILLLCDSNSTIIVCTIIVCT